MVSEIKVRARRGVLAMSADALPAHAVYPVRVDASLDEPTWRVQYYAIGAFGTDKYPPFRLDVGGSDPSGG